MNTWKLILATVVIFGTGVLTGGLLVNHVSRAKPKVSRPRPPVVQPGQLLPPPRELPRRPEQELQRSLEQRRLEFLLHASRELRLSPEQQERVDRLLGESQERARRLWEQFKPQIRKELGEVTEKFRQELSPDQRQLFEELMKRQQPRRSDEATPGPRPPREGRRPVSPRDGPVGAPPDPPTLP